MSKKPFYFTLPVGKFDTNLLPASARAIGSDAFKDAVVAHFVAEYAGKGGGAVVGVDDEQISVLALPAGADPLDFVMTMLQEGRIKEAIPFLESMAKVDKDNAQLLYNLGIGYSELGQFDEAIIRLKRAVSIDPSHAHAWTGIGVAYQRMGKPALALEPMQAAVTANPRDGYSQRNLGALFLSLGRANEGLAHMRQARQALPHDPQTTFGLASALDELGGSQNLAEADELFQVIIDRWPGSQLAELSRTARTKLAHSNMRSAVDGGLRPDVVMYISSALDILDRESADRGRQIAVEIALKGQDGLDINDPEQKYTLKTLPGKFSGMHLVSIMYAAFKRIDPTMDAGIDLAAEYQAALALRQ